MLRSRLRLRNRAVNELAGRGGLWLPLFIFVDCLGNPIQMNVPLPKLTPQIVKPRLSARSAAKFLHLPALEQMKLLHDQKFPKQAPQVFMQPYYAPPIAGIRGFLEVGAPALIDARAQIQSIKVPSRRMHCLRVLEQFVQSEHAQRGLKPTAIKRYSTMLHDLELRLSPDLWAYEGDEERIIYFNANVVPQDPEWARKTLEIAHWVLEQNGVEVLPRQVEFIDLTTGVLHKFKHRRQKTIKDLADNAKIITSLWPTIDP